MPLPVPGTPSHRWGVPSEGPGGVSVRAEDLAAEEERRRREYLPLDLAPDRVLFIDSRRVGAGACDGCMAQVAHHRGLVACALTDGTLRLNYVRAMRAGCSRQSCE